MSIKYTHKACKINHHILKSPPPTISKLRVVALSHHKHYHHHHCSPDLKLNQTNSPHYHYIKSVCVPLTRDEDTCTEICSRAGFCPLGLVRFWSYWWHWIIQIWQFSLYMYYFANFQSHYDFFKQSKKTPSACIREICIYSWIQRNIWHLSAVY